MELYKSKLKSFRSRYFLTKSLETLLIILSVIIILFTTYSFFAFYNKDNYSFLKTIEIIFKILTFLIFIYGIIRVIFNIRSLKFIAEKISKVEPPKNEIILSTLELEKEQNRNVYSPQILKANVEIANKKANQLTFKDIYPSKNLFYDLKLFIFASFICLISILSNSNRFFTAYRSLLNVAEFAPQYDLSIDVHPGNTIVLKHSNLKVQIKNYYPELNYNLIYEKNHRKKNVVLSKNFYMFYNIDDSIRYSLKNDIACSDTFTINIIEKPIIKNLNVEYNYPEYTQIPSKIEEDASGNIIALSGTNIKISLVVNNELVDYRIVFANGETKKLNQVSDCKYSTKFEVTETTSYHFYFEDILHNKNKFIERNIFAEPDLPPTIEILEPAEDKILAQNMKEDITFSAVDDFGISDILIVFKKNEQDYTSRFISKNNQQPSIRETYTFDLNDQNLLPGDVIFYYLKVFDNCTIPEKQMGKSRIYLLKFPSIEELYDEINQKQEENYEDLSKAFERTKKSKEKFEKLRRKFLKTEELDWEQKEEIKSTIKEQKELAKIAEQTAQDYKKFIEQVEKNKAVSKQTLDKLKQIQEIMKDIANKELEEAMKKVREALEKITPEQMKKALNDFKFSQEDFLNRLERTLELLKNIQKEQNMQKLLQQAEEIEKLQKELNKLTSNKINSGEDIKELSKQQRDIAEKYNELKKEIEKQIESLKQSGDNSSAEELQNALEHAQESQLSENLQKAIQQLKSNDMKNTPSTQCSICNTFSRLKEFIQMAQQCMQCAMKQRFEKLIKKTINNLVYFSNIQEKVLNESFKAYDILEKEIFIYEGLKNLVNNLFSNPLIILSLNPGFSKDTAEAYNHFENMFEKLRERSNYNIQNYKVKIYASINKMIIDLLLSKGMMKPSGGGMQQLMQQLQQLSQQQGSINMLTQALMEQMMMQSLQQQGLTPEQRKMIDRIAANEQQIKENLERILRDFPESKKLMGDLNSVKEEIKEVIEQLKKGIIDDKLIKKQQRILSRLLDAQKSIHERDYSRKREAETPEQKKYVVPDSLKIDIKDINTRDILKFINENYPEEYHNLIKKYLEKIQNEK